MNRNQKGFAHIGLVLVVLVLLVIGLAGWRILGSKSETKQNNTSTSQTQESASSSQANSTISWQFDGTQWKPNGTPPSCPSPLSFPSPVDISKVTSVLYPGQYRGGNYKPHGGFRFADHTNTNVTVTVPLDATVYKASRYIEQGEVQYLFVFISPCGIMYRFDHLLALSSEFQKLADTLPAAKPDDSRTTNFNSGPQFKAGAVVATAVGFSKTGNTGVDFGVYDLRQRNTVSQTAQWQQKHQGDIESGAFGICWLNNLSNGASKIALALPGADQTAGKQSDYCK